MSRVDLVQERIDAHKREMFDSFMDLLRASMVVAEELGVVSIYVSGYAGTADVRFYGERFPYDAGVAKRVSSTAEGVPDEMVIDLGDVSLSCFVPKEG